MSVEYSHIRPEGFPIPTITTNHIWDEESVGATEAVRIATRGHSVIHIHNHPNGVEASDADKAFYKRLGKFGVVLVSTHKISIKATKRNESSRVIY